MSFILLFFTRIYRDGAKNIEKWIFGSGIKFINLRPMRKIIYAFGIATFLAMFIFTIATSLTNPFYGMSEAAIAETLSLKSTGACPLQTGYCLPTGCMVDGYVVIGSDATAWFWQYNGCNSYCRPGGNNCCYNLSSTGCD